LQYTTFDKEVDLIVVEPTSCPTACMLMIMAIKGASHLDMSAYGRFFKGELEDFDYSDEVIQPSLNHLPKAG
jgi:hypothetical protein